MKFRGSIQAFPVAVDHSVAGAEQLTYAVDEEDVDLELVVECGLAFWRVTQAQKLDGVDSMLLYFVPAGEAVVVVGAGEKVIADESRALAKKVTAALISGLLEIGKQLSEQFRPATIEELALRAPEGSVFESLRDESDDANLGGVVWAELIEKIKPAPVGLPSSLDLAAAKSLSNLTAKEIEVLKRRFAQDPDVLARIEAHEQIKAEPKPELPTFSCSNCKSVFGGKNGELEAWLCGFRCNSEQPDLGDACLCCGYPEGIHGSRTETGCNLTLDGGRFVTVESTRAGKSWMAQHLEAWITKKLPWPPVPAHMRRPKCRLCESYIDLHEGVTEEGQCNLKSTAFGNVNASGELADKPIVQVRWTRDGLAWVSRQEGGAPALIGVTPENLPVLD